MSFVGDTTMNAKRFTSLALGISLAAHLSLALANPTGSVYTANERAASISQVDLDTGVISTVALPISPHNVQVSPDGSLLLVVGISGHAGHSSGEKASGQLLVFSTAGLDRPQFSLPAGNHPAHVVTDSTGQRAFVTDSAANRVRVFDLKKQVELPGIPTGRYPHGLRLSPDGQTLYVANMRSDSVSLIDVTTLKETAQIPVGNGPVQVGFAPDGRLAFVSLSAANQLGIIDTAEREVIGKVDVGRTPIQMMATVDGLQVYVANQGSGQNPDDRVSIVDPQTRSSIGTVTTGRGAHGVAISTDGAYVFVSNIEAGTVSVIDTNSRKVVGTHKVGAGPNGISYKPPKAE
ncbi:beta-propeller fold lactonase family protein [Pseudomonas sp. D(2018)]|uniref:YVTN family beta-propeller repeat protein n=1 Tax=Pseudomonas sp. D(2018) TaxID=2502238 RepID=UPI002114B3ED|nr:beta-propeller fold lactonase family protein [Pseudomonas sp. D(2018)]